MMENSSKGIVLFIVYIMSNYEVFTFCFSPDSCNPHNLGVGSTIQYMDFNQYGVIKWIGSIPGSKEIFAGLEMVCTYVYSMQYCILLSQV